MIKFMRGTSTKRAASSKVLEAGQPFFETDTKKIYVGDGSTALSSLVSIDNYLKTQLTDGSVVAKKASQWETARTFTVQDNDGTNKTTASVNGSADVTLKLPSTIKATLTGNADTATKATNDSDGNKITTYYTPFVISSIHTAQDLKRAIDDGYIETIKTYLSNGGHIDIISTTTNSDSKMAQVIWRVVHAGDLGNYGHSGTNGCILQMMNIQSNGIAWNTTSSNTDYANSTIHTWLNGTFNGWCDTSFTNYIKSGSCKVGAGDSYEISDASFNYFFLPSANEVMGYSSSSQPSAEGDQWLYWKYLIPTASTSSNDNRILPLTSNSSNTYKYWWLRTPSTSSSDRAWYVYFGGSLGFGDFVVYTHFGVSPACIIY